MIKYSPSAVTSKIGVNFVRSLTERAGSLFHKIEQENDLGIDAILEIVIAGRPVNVQLGVQIKSGDSYYDVPTETCTIPVDRHREYWARYPLPVIGCVFIPRLERAHWVDIKKALRNQPDRNAIEFVTSEANALSSETFASVFVPLLIGNEPHLSLEKASELVNSSKIDDSFLGLRVLFRQYPNERSTWDILVGYFRRNSFDRIPPTLAYHLAHIPWHSDIAHSGAAITTQTREYARGLISRFGQPEVLKLLRLIDRDNGISRGAIGQSVEAVISSIPHVDAYLTDIATDSSNELMLCEFAALILAMHNAEQAVGVLLQLRQRGSWFVDQVLEVIQEFGSVNPYS